VTFSSHVERVSFGSTPGAKFGTRVGVLEKRGDRHLGHVFDWVAEEFAHSERQVEPKMWLQGVRTGTWEEEKVSWHISHVSIVSRVERKVCLFGRGGFGMMGL
jgi:hypothetical protein